MQENIILLLYQLPLLLPSPLPRPLLNALPGLRAEAMLKKTGG